MKSTKDKLEDLKKDLFHHMDGLDDTFEVCGSCGLRNYTSKSESLTKRKLQDVVRGVDFEIQKLENGTADVKDRN